MPLPPPNKRPRHRPWPRTLAEALNNADRREADLPKIAFVDANDYDLIVLADRVRELEKMCGRSTND